jgi:hypothetical protein
MNFLKKHGYRLFGLIMLLIVALFSNRIINDDNKSLIKNKALTTCIVTSVDYFPRGLGFYVSYELKLNSILLKNRKTLTIEKSELNKVNSILLGQSMPLVYDKTDSDNNQIILSMKDCIEYNVDVDYETEIILLRLDSMLVK